MAERVATGETPLTVKVSPGVYRVTATYEEFSETKTVNVRAGESRLVEFRWYIEKKPPVKVPLGLLALLGIGAVLAVEAKRRGKR